MFKLLNFLIFLGANEPHLKDRMKVRITFQVLAVTKPGKPVVYSNEGVKDDLDPSLENQVSFLKFSETMF